MDDPNQNGGDQPANDVAPAADVPNAAASPVGSLPASDTALSASPVLPDAGTAAPLDPVALVEPDHKSILETLFADLEGIVHMGKTEIIAVIDRAKALL